MITSIGGKAMSRVALGGANLEFIRPKHEMFDIIDLYRSLGGNCVDVARVYGSFSEGGRLGASENVLGQYLRERGRGGLIISTKGAHPDVRTMHTPRMSRGELAADLDASLVDLGIDETDIYFLHRDDTSRAAGEIIENLNELAVKPGKTRYLGASNWTSARIAEANSYAASHGLAGFSVVQNRCSLAATTSVESGDDTTTTINRGDADFEWFRRESFPIMAYTSLARGYIAVKASGGDASRFHEYDTPENAARVAACAEVASELGEPVTAVALAALIASAPDMAALVSSKQSGRIADAMRACEIKLSDEAFEKIWGGKL